jgi:hypothetical protein
MTSGQWRVLLLLLVLFGLEAVRSGPVQDFFTAVFKPFTTGSVGTGTQKGS